MFLAAYPFDYLTRYILKEAANGARQTLAEAKRRRVGWYAVLGGSWLREHSFALLITRLSDSDICF